MQAYQNLTLTHHGKSTVSAKYELFKGSNALVPWSSTLLSGMKSESEWLTCTDCGAVSFLFVRDTLNPKFG